LEEGRAFLVTRPLSPGPDSQSSFSDFGDGSVLFPLLLRCTRAVDPAVKCRVLVAFFSFSVAGLTLSLSSCFFLSQTDLSGRLSSSSNGLCLIHRVLENHRVQLVLLV
jgi:hypothetical protein